VDWNLNWVYIAISWVLLRWHDLWSALFGPESYFAWVLAIVFLVITVRIILFPVFVKQIKSQRAMQTLQPQVKALQEKYKGDKETLQKEVMELYRREKANPLMGCLPMFLQIPVFLGLFHVLKLIDPTKSSNQVAMIKEYFWSEGEFKGAAAAKLFGAPLAGAFNSPAAKLEALHADRLNVQIVAGLLIITMVATTYITQRQMIARTGKNSDPQQAMIQKLMLYGIPASLLISGALFPIGVVIYWVTTNLFSMGQQFWVLKKMPPPKVDGKTPAKEVSPEAAKALAPKPGVKPANPKKGQRPKANATESAESLAAEAEAAKPSEPQPDDSSVNGRAADPAGTATPNQPGTRRPQDARNRKRKGGRR
jgi:YidC/Oxa1 family membrane protein insertase